MSAPTVGRLLRGQGFSLQAPAKTLEGKQHPDRDAQFRYISTSSANYIAAGQPVIAWIRRRRNRSASTPTAGGSGGPVGEPERVNVHDFPGPGVGKAIPYGVYDVGWDSAGSTSVRSRHGGLRRREHPPWWRSMGAESYPEASRLLITADGGGSNGYRLRLWKVELPALGRRDGHGGDGLPPPAGTTKWNKIEHRLFSHITMNWRGRPLASHRGRGEQHRRHAHPRRAARDSRTGHRKLSGGELGQPRAAGRTADPPARAARHLELHHRPGQRPRVPGRNTETGTWPEPRPWPCSPTPG